MTDFYIHAIIPVYNCKDYLEEAVNSVLKQEYERIEILLIDDGSKRRLFCALRKIGEKFR